MAREEEHQSSCQTSRTYLGEKPHSAHPAIRLLHYSTRGASLPEPAQNTLAPLIAETAGQEARFASALTVLREAIAARAFPGAAVAVTQDGRMLLHAGLGRFRYEQDSPAVAAGTLYDIASVTKVVSTTPIAMLLYERGLLDLEMPLASVLREFAGPDARREHVTVRMLLAHSSGLPGYEPLYKNARGRNQLLRAACTVPLACDPGARAEYSDIGFLLLGEALSRLAEEELGSFSRREIFGRLGMAHTGYIPPERFRSSCAPTEDDKEFRRRIIQGEVHDENAAALCGVSGHAGVFSTAGDVAAFAHAMLEGGAPILRPETVSLFTRRESSSAGTTRALGWDTPGRPSQSGKHFSPASFGHLGYTGTSLWIDPEKRISIALLTNRTWPDRSSNAIKEVRPRFHDAVMEALR